MKISNQGIEFKYYHDVLTWLWPWRRQHGGKFWSDHFNHSFPNLNSYWMRMGTLDAVLTRFGEKVNGHSWIEILCVWVNVTYSMRDVVVLYNVNVSAKGVSFWAKIPREKIEDLMQDVIVLRCKDRAEVFRLISSIPPSFADACGFVAGRFIGTNEETEEA